MGGFRQFRHGRIFNQQPISQRSVRPSLDGRGSGTVFLKNSTVTCDFPGKEGSDPPVRLFGSAHAIVIT